MAALDISQLPVLIGTMSKKLISKTLAQAKLEDYFLVDGKVANVQTYTRLKINPDLEAYNDRDDAGDNKMVWAKEDVKVSAATDNYPFDPENYRFKFDTDLVKTTSGEVPFFQQTLQDIAQTLMIDVVFLDTIWNGDTSLTTGPKNKRIIDGFKKKLLALRIAGAIPAVSTGAITGGSGWPGSTITYGNVTTSVKKVWDALPLGIRQRGANVYLPPAIYDMYEENERRAHGQTKYYVDPDGGEYMAIHGSLGKGRIVNALFMGAGTEVIFATPKENLVFAHDAGLSSSLSKMTTKGDLHDKFWVGFKFVFGVGIINPEEIVINDRS